jgi:hypothetical protein
MSVHANGRHGSERLATGESGAAHSGGTAAGVTAYSAELEVARRTGRARIALSECHRALIRATDEQELIDTICRIAVDVAGYSLAWVGFGEHDERKTVRPVARYGKAASYVDDIEVTWGPDALGRGPTGTTIRTGQVRVARDIVAEASRPNSSLSSPTISLLAFGCCANDPSEIGSPLPWINRRSP